MQLRTTRLLILVLAPLVSGCGKQVPIPSLAPRQVPTPYAAPSKVAGVPPAVFEEPKAEVAPADSKPAALPEAPPEGAPAAAESALPAEKPAAESAVAAAEPEVLFADSFADQTGSVKKNADGKTKLEVPGNTRTVHMFRGQAEEGSLLIQVFEDPKTAGPDGEPGVLALSWQEVPGKLPYCGFVYLGRTKGTERMTLPPLLLTKTADELKGYRLTFRYRGVNDKPKDAAAPKEAGEGKGEGKKDEGKKEAAKDDAAKDDAVSKDEDKAAEPEAVKIPINWRLEPMLADSYNKRLDLGKFTATEEWGTVDIGLKEGTNVEAFLKALADEHPTAFKIVWAQGAPIGSYHAGDTLLIDDIKITRAK